MLLFVEMLVGACERDVQVLACQPLADADRPADGISPAAQTLQRGLRAGRRCVRQQQRELIAAVAGKDVAGSQTLTPLLAERRQQATRTNLKNTATLTRP